MHFLRAQYVISSEHKSGISETVHLNLSSCCMLSILPWVILQCLQLARVQIRVLSSIGFLWNYRSTASESVRNIEQRSTDYPIQMGGTFCHIRSTEPLRQNTVIWNRNRWKILWLLTTGRFTVLLPILVCRTTCFYIDIPHPLTTQIRKHQWRSPAKYTKSIKLQWESTWVNR